MSADQFAVLAGGAGAGIDGGTNRADVAAYQRGDISAADLDLPGQGDVGRLAHGIGGRDGGDQALGFDQAQRLVIVFVASSCCHWMEPQKLGVMNRSCLRFAFAWDSPNAKR